MAELLKVAASIEPIVLLALVLLALAATIFLIIWKVGAPVKAIESNHLHDVTELLQQLVDGQGRTEQTLTDIRDGINYLKGKADARR